jgi:hypothetical protein
MNSKATELLLQAIRKGDREELKAAIAAGADLDHNGGEPLQMLAEKGDLHSAKELILKGASIAWARKHAKQKQDQAARRYSAAKGGSAEEKEAQAEGLRCGGIVLILDAYKETITELLGILQVQRQQDTVLALRELTEEIKLITRPQMLDKPLPAAKAPSLKGTAP